MGAGGSRRRRWPSACDSPATVTLHEATLADIVNVAAEPVATTWRERRDSGGS